MAKTTSNLPASVVTITDQSIEPSTFTEPSSPSITPTATIVPPPISQSLPNSETLETTAPFSPSSDVPTSQPLSGEQGQNPEVTKSSAIVATDSMVVEAPVEEEKNVLTVVEEEGAIVAVGGDAVADTTRESHEEPDPSPEDPAPEMRSSDEEDLDNMGLNAFISKRRVVSTPEFEIKLPTTRLQVKVTYYSTLQKSKKSSQKKKRKLVKDAVPVSDEAIPIVDVEEETLDEPGSLVRWSSKKIKPTSLEKGPTSKSKIKEGVSEFSMTDEDVLIKSKGKGKVSGEKSGKRKSEPFEEPVSVKKMRSKVTLALCA
uniref:Uncharacterized protein n=1 Tax=Nicotiana tabacum TaxID=4097 RepID=A0A1S3ZNM3_TOBAC|nr:PREDICTED: uncharacterized protein LOC107788757 [Nicotiana tabacum]